MNFSLNGRVCRPESGQLLDDLRRFALMRGRCSVTYKEYMGEGGFYPSIFVRRFGSWNNALRLAGLEVRKVVNVGKVELLENLQVLWVVLGRQPVLEDLCRPLSRYGRKPYVRVFGSWSRCLIIMAEWLNSSIPHERDTVAQLGVVGATPTLKGDVTQDSVFATPTLKGGDISAPEKEALSLLQNGGINFGSDMQGSVFATPTLPKSKSGQVTGGAMQGSVFASPTLPKSKSGQVTGDVSQDSGFGVSIFKHRTPREVGWRVRHLVMKRDCFRCVACGVSPATRLGVVLHVDHIVPYSKGGESVVENLKTLCEVCNGGKSNI